MSLSSPFPRPAAALAFALLAAPVVAVAATAYHAPEALQRPGFTSIQPWGINDAGTIVGSSDSVGFVLANGVFQSVQHPLANAGTVVTGISNAGAMVGLYNVDDGAGSVTTSAFTLEGNVFTPFAYDGYVSTQLRAISSDGRYLSGMVFGTSAALGFVFDRSAGTTTWLSYPNSFQTVAQGVNRHGQVVGTHYPGAPSRPSFVRDLTQGTEVLIPTVAGFSNPRLRALNDAGTIGGFVIAGSAVIGTPTDGWFVFDKPSGVASMGVYGLNSAGVAVGWSVPEGGDGTQTVGWIARPVPEPGTWALLLLGGVAVLGAARRRAATRA